MGKLLAMAFLHEQITNFQRYNLQYLLRKEIKVPVSSSFVIYFSWVRGNTLLTSGLATRLTQFKHKEK